MINAEQRYLLWRASGLSQYRSERKEVGKAMHLRCNVIDLLAFKRVLNGHGVRHRAWLF